MIDAHHGWNASVKPVVLGFILSVVLTFAAYRITTQAHLVEWELLTLVIVLGSLQALIQLVFFLHVGLESRPRWNLLMFLLTVFLVAIIIGGSVWIMHNVNHNLMIEMPHGP